MTEALQWARYHWQRLMGGRTRDDNERPYNYSSLLACRGKSSHTPKLAGKHRVVVPHLRPFKEEYEKFSGTYVNNRIRTTKYTLLNFVPRNLFEQFHRAANLYFLFLVVLNWVPLVEAFQKEITMLPLVVVLTIIAIKDGLEDYRKYKIDKQINNLVTKVYSRPAVILIWMPEENKSVQAIANPGCGKAKAFVTHIVHGLERTKHQTVRRETVFNP